MASLKSLVSFNWLLIEWKSGSRNVIHVKSVVSPLDEEPKPGDVIKFNWRAEQRTATLIAHARDRETLDAMVKESVKAEARPSSKSEAGPSSKSEASSSRTYEEGEDFSSSGSSWVPSADEGSAESDTGGTRVKSKTRKQTYKTPTGIRKYSKRRRTLAKIMSIENLLPDSTQLSNREKLQNEEVMMGKMDEVENAFKKIFNLIGNLERQSAQNQNSQENVKIQIKAELSETPNEQSVHEDEEEDSDELNRSTDNVLITNKHNLAERNERVEDELENVKIQIKAELSETPNEQSVHEDEEEDSDELNRSTDNVLITNKHNLAERNERVEEELENVKMQIKAELSETPNKQSVHEAEEEDSGELNRSTDNVLITNKHSLAERNERVEDELVPIGSGKTLVQKDKFRKVNWRSYTIATRTLLLALFPRRILATHSLTGKKSPAFQTKAVKMCLDPKIISDVIIEITKRFNVQDNIVRKIITNKCADECKMYKTRKNKRKSQNDENMPPATNNNSDEEEIDILF